MAEYQSADKLILNYLLAIAPIICERVYKDNTDLIDRACTLGILEDDLITWELNFEEYLSEYSKVFESAIVRYTQQFGDRWQVLVYTNPNVLVYNSEDLFEICYNLTGYTDDTINYMNNVASFVKGFGTQRIKEGQYVNLLAWAEFARAGYIYSVKAWNILHKPTHRIVLSAKYNKGNAYSFDDFGLNEHIFFSFYTSSLPLAKDFEAFNSLGGKYGVVYSGMYLTIHFMRGLEEFLQQGVITKNVMLCLNVAGDKYLDDARVLLDRYGIEYYFDQKKYKKAIAHYLYEVYGSDDNPAFISLWDSEEKIKQALYE